jgi:hypothetical protein
MPAHVWADGAWRSLNDIQVGIGGAYRRVDTAYVWNDGAWRTAFQYDVTGPSGAYNVSAAWGNAYGELAFVQWNQPGDADLAYSDLYVDRGAGYVYIGRFTQGPNVACAYADYGLTFNAVSLAGYATQATNVHTYLIRPFDVRGNQGTDVTVQTRGAGDSVVRGMVKSPIIMNPSSSATWSSDGYWRTDNNQVLQGRNNFGRHFGHWFYGNTVPWRFNVSSAEIIARRMPNAGYAQERALGLKLSNADSGFFTFGGDPTGQIVTGRVDSGAFAWNESEWTYLPADWAADLISSTGINRNSIVIDSDEGSVTSYGFSFNYARFEGQGYDIAFGISSGAIRIYHSG